jgi:uncharacterized membrane protein (DUF106 family)
MKIILLWHLHQQILIGENFRKYFHVKKNLKKFAKIFENFRKNKNSKKFKKISKKCEHNFEKM